MSIQPTEWIWKNGKLVPWAEATVHVLTHGLHYGSSVFEGIRVYETPGGPAFFRLKPHIERLFRSAKIHGMPLPLEVHELEDACAETVRANGLKCAYVRPLAFRGMGTLGFDPTPSPVEIIIAAVEWGRLLGAEGIENGIDVCVSSWQRCAPNTMPLLAKAGGNYLSSQLMHNEAKRNGYTEAIGLSYDGTVSEGSGENIFVIRDGVIYTPGSDQSILCGITRASVITLAEQLGVEVREARIPRESLYVADEIFLTGTAAEITPVRSVDRTRIGNGGRGEITHKIQDAFFGLFDGSTEDRFGWLTPIEVRA